MSNYNEESREESRFSFLTVNSVIDHHEQSKVDNKGNTNSTNTIEINQVSNKSQHKGSLINSSINQSDLKENFEEMPLQLSNHEKNKFKNITPHLVVEYKGEKKDYIGTYKNYEISEINGKNEKRILCYRRYDNFDIFYNKLKKKYPYLLIPKLIGKNPLMKIMTVDSEFFNKRKRQLNYFLNYLYSHKILSEKREFLKFINDPEFDEEYFKKEEVDVYDFPESSKHSETISNKIYGVFSNISTYFKHKNEEFKPSEAEIDIKNMEAHYKNLMENFRENKNHLEIYIYNIKRSSENYSELSNNFFYLKDVNFDSQNTKEYFNKYHEICNDLVKINKTHYDKTGVALEDKFEGFLSILTGLCDTFDRYSEFLKAYHMVQKASEDSKVNTRNYDKTKISREMEVANEKKIEFEKAIKDETKSFVDKYTDEYTEILENYKLLIKSINANEANKLENYTNYFTK